MKLGRIGNGYTWHLAEKRPMPDSPVQRIYVACLNGHIGAYTYEEREVKKGAVNIDNVCDSCLKLYPQGLMLKALLTAEKAEKAEDNNESNRNDT